MRFNLHTTTKAERDAAMATPGEPITLDPAQLHGPGSLVWDEDTGEWYEHDSSDFRALLASFDADPSYDYCQSAYFARYKATAHAHGLFTRLAKLPALLADIRANGVQSPVHVEATGQRLDGSYRTKIAMYLGLKEVPAMLHRFRWQDVGDATIGRLIEARHRTSPVDYYEFAYGRHGWRNVPEQRNPVYRENARRADTIVGLVRGRTVLDLGCNEGYISLAVAQTGAFVTGVDLEHIGNANLNRLVLEYVGGRDLFAHFVEGDIASFQTRETPDTVLMLNVLYHLPRAVQAALLNRYARSRIVFQCNLRKEAEREKYYTSHPDDLLALLATVGRTATLVEYGDKPIYVSNP